MNIENIRMVLKSKIKEENLISNELMSKHTTYKIGGPADLYVKPQNIDEFVYAVRSCRENDVEFIILGKGSNLLVGDKGIKGVVIEMGKGISKIDVDGEYMYAEAGAMLINASYAAYKNSLVGFEFACGIPGTIGGAVYMNAGAYKGEMKDILVDAKVLDAQNNVITLTNEELKLGYRHSIIQEEDYIVLSARMKFEKGNMDEIQEKRERLVSHRKAGQPMDMPSAGSVFKRPEGHYSGKLIEDAGLKGYCVGGAKVSEKHANFIVNSGNATAKDVMTLVEYIQKIVFEENKIMLEPEVRLIGEM